MRRLFLGLCVIVAMTGWAATAASGDCGPSPGVTWGWDGVLARSGQVRYVTLPGARNTVLAVVRVSDGRVVNFRWLRGSYGVPLVAYTASKHAVIGLTRTGALELARHGIRVNAVCPSPIETAVVSVPAVVRLATTAPAKTAGAVRYPNSRIAAMARPLGGQIGVVLGWMEAKARPVLARTK